MVRYLVYDVDKHQSSPYFTDELPWWVTEESQPDCDDFTLSVVVDMQEHRRFWRGQWDDVAMRIKSTLAHTLTDVVE